MKKKEGTSTNKLLSWNCGLSTTELEAEKWVPDIKNWHRQNNLVKEQWASTLHQVLVEIFFETINDYKKKNQSQDIPIAFLRFHVAENMLNVHIQESCI